MSEDPWDDWETAADAGLIDYDLPKQKVTTTTTSKEPLNNNITPKTNNNTAKTSGNTAVVNQKLWEKANEYATPVIIHSISNTNALHTEYKPELKILRRPDDARNKKDAVTEKPIKPLADREKDYLEARRKIFDKFDKK